MFSTDFNRRSRRLVFSLALAAVLPLAQPAFAANYPLELVSPRAVGSAPAAGGAPITAGHRIFKAYPGLEYNIRAVVIGGAYPYRFELSDAPTGMTVDAQTGLVVWPNPQESARPVITVTDSEGSQVSSDWSISVTTAGFRFVDAVNGRNHPFGVGTSSNPWRAISDIVVSPSAGPGDVIYFRRGTYTALGLPRVSVGSAWERVEFSASSQPVAWLAYPGETPVIDFGFRPGVENGVIFRFSGANVYLDGFEARNARIIGLQLTSGSSAHHRVLRRLRMHGLNEIRANLDGTNSALIMTTSNYSNSDAGGDAGSWAQYLAIQDCEFFDAPADMALKTYSHWKLLVEDNTFRDMYFGVELKADMPRFTYRANRHYRLSGRSIGGNMHSYTTHGEILFNLVNEPNGQFALDVNQDSQARRIDIYRNTFVGRVRVRSVDSTDGPFRFYENVIVNNDAGTPTGSHIYHERVSDASRVESFSNLTGYPDAGIVDADGLLTPAFSEYLGIRGYQMAPTGPQPAPPRELTVQ